MSNKLKLGLVIGGIYAIAQGCIWKMIYDTELENAKMQQQIADVKAKMKFVDILTGRKEEES